jgi:hypothetical protein
MVLPSQNTMKAPPPMPELCGSARLSTSWTATAASTALPPAARISRPAWAARGLAAATMSLVAEPAVLAMRPVGASGAGITAWAKAGDRAGAARQPSPTRLRRRIRWMSIVSFPPLIPAGWLTDKNWASLTKDRPGALLSCAA